MKYVTTYYWNAGVGGRKNEDSLSLQKVSVKHRDAVFMIVCDGIGGLSRGEWASGFVAERMTQWFWERAVGVLTRRGWEEVLERSAVRQMMSLQEEMEWYEKNYDLRCGTTCTMAVVCNRRFLVLHCGDSRAYLLGKKERQLTTDHRCDNRLMKCIGDFGFQRPDKICGKLKKGEILLLCTDGYCSGAPEGFFLESLIRKNAEESALSKDLQKVGRFLLAHGEQDNLTAAALKCV